MSCWNDCDALLRRAVPLAPLTTWGMGGAAEYYAEPVDLAGLGCLLSQAERHQVRVRLLGNGSNVLVQDGSLRGLVIRLASPSFAQIRIEEDTGLLFAGAGAPLAVVARLAMQHGFAGLENLAGIPGTVGGAVRMNAGSGPHTIGLVVEEVGAIDPAGRFACFSRSNLFFAYRHSNLTDLVVTDVVMRLRPDRPARIEARYRQALERKRESQPLGEKTAGCVFKNPPGLSAGRLIDEAGCKGLSQGDAVVSSVHANFIVNRGAATFSDMLRLIELVRLRVEDRTGIELELEVEIWV